MDESETMMSEPTAHRPLVLVADDEPAIRRLVSEVLDGAGFRTMTVADGATVPALAARHRPDLIMLDIIMPGVDGYATAAHLQGDRATRDIPIVFVTAQDAPVYRTVGSGLGARAHLTKPFTAGQLAQVVRRVLGRPEGAAAAGATR
ncbi:MAG: response regulator [Candidatus Rokuibacteriota bacterium]